MNKARMSEAKKLAALPYTISKLNDETTDGEPIIVLYNPELPGCMAQGTTMQEALDNLLDARQEYILSLLEDGQPVPLPNQDISQSESRVGTNVTLTFSVSVGVNLPKKATVQQKKEDLSQLGDTAKYEHQVSSGESKAAIQPAKRRATIVRQV
jgi:predicted RNase H-like HicB family nuclease